MFEAAISVLDWKRIILSNITTCCKFKLLYGISFTVNIQGLSPAMVDFFFYKAVAVIDVDLRAFFSY